MTVSEPVEVTVVVGVVVGVEVRVVVGVVVGVEACVEVAVGRLTLCATYSLFFPRATSTSRRFPLEVCRGTQKNRIRESKAEAGTVCAARLYPSCRTRS